MTKLIPLDNPILALAKLLKLLNSTSETHIWLALCKHNSSYNDNCISFQDMAGLPFLAVIDRTQIKGDIRLHFLTAYFTGGAVVVTV
jgi:hypothetical protein